MYAKLLTRVTLATVTLIDTSMQCNAMQCDFRQRKFSQPEIQNKYGHKSCQETSMVKSHLVQAKGGFKRSYALITEEEG